MIDRLLTIAAAEIGYREKASNAQLDDKTANAGAGNWTKYWRDTVSVISYNGQTLPWCADFIVWCALKAGIGKDIIPYDISCPRIKTWFESKGFWKSRSSGYAPKRGDLIIFSNNGKNASHIGIVEKVSEAAIETIEGNSGDAVNNRKYAPGAASILGYCSVQYPVEVTNASQARAAEVKAALDKLTKAGIINSPDYWLKNYNELPYLDELIIEMGAHV